MWKGNAGTVTILKFLKDWKTRISSVYLIYKYLYYFSYLFKCIYIYLYIYIYIYEYFCITFDE